MPALLLSPLFLRIAGVIAMAVVAGVLWYKAEHWCNTACVNKQKEIVTLTGKVADRDASIATTQKRATELAMLWSRQVDATESATHESETLRNEKFAGLRADAAHAPNPAHFGGVSVSVFDSARSAASGEAAGPAAKPAEAAPPAASSAEEFVVAMYEWAAICRSRVDEWQLFYRGLQQATESKSTGPE
jgi:hypothetical protein